MKAKRWIILCTIIVSSLLFLVLFVHSTETFAQEGVFYADDPDYVPSVTSGISGQLRQGTLQASAPYSLTTFYATNNGQRGNMFDVIAGTQGVCITSFDFNAYAGTTARYELYYKPGTYVGYENTAASWTFVGGIDSLTSNGNNVPTPLNLGGIYVPAGERYGIYMTNDFGGGLSYTDSDGTYLKTNSALTITDGIGKSYPFGLTFTTRTWNGTVHYSHNQADCDVFDVSVTNSNNTTTITPGLSSAYTVVVANTSLVSDTNVAVETLFNIVLSSVNWTCTAVNGTCASPTGTGNVSETVFVQANGRLTYTINALMPADIAAPVIHTATITGTNDVSVANNIAVDTDGLAPTRCALQTGVNYLYDNDLVTAAVDSSTDLYCLKIERISATHPNATANMTDGYYWDITGTTAVNTPATDFSVSLTFPHTGGINPTICRYPGDMGGFGWDCTGSQTATATTVSRAGVTAFSEWMIGYDVGPTAVSLQSISAHSTTALPVLVLLLVLIGGLTAVYFRRATNQ